MSPLRDPRERSIRRAEQSIRIERRQREEESVPRRSAPDRPAGCDQPRPSAGLEQWDETAFDAVPLRAKHAGRRADRARRRAARRALPVEVPVEGAAGELLAEPARVVGVARGPCAVELADGSVVRAFLPKALARDDRGALAVGDRVLLARRASGELVVDRLLPRASRLARPDPHAPQRERVLAANLDLAVVVASFRRPPLSTGLVDRFLVALAWGDVPAAIAVNKLDLADRDDAERSRLEPYHRLGVPVVLCSAKSGAGLAALRALVAGRTVAFVGHSGVGKSSLLNALLPGAGAAVGEVADGSARGRHTTSAARIYRAGDGTRIVDTPGVREFGLWRMTPRELAGYFEEFAAPALACRFSDCSHRHEPRCAVRAAVERGEIAAERYATYLRVLASLAEE